MEKEIRKVPEWFYLELIEACAEVKNYKCAIGYCNRLLDTQPVDMNLLCTKAMLQYKNHDFSEALKTLKVLRENDFEKLYEKDAEVLYYYAFAGMILEK
jgi:tetratricopeptide (TPR) repeat protein